MIDDQSRSRLSHPDSFIHTMFEAVAVAHPEAVAVVCGSAVLQFRELNEQANRLARHLRQRGVGAETCVGVCLERGTDVAVAMLAILKAGGVYVPLDPRAPAPRLKTMLADTGTRFVLTRGDAGNTIQSVRGAALTCIDLPGDASQWLQQDGTNLEADGANDAGKRLAYVIFTSGSTGRPKAVGVEHGALRNLVTAQLEYLGLSVQSRVLQISSFSFDAHIFEMFMALCSGAALHFAMPGEALVGETLAAAIVGGAITHLTITPTVLETISTETALPSLQTLVVAGEAVSAETARRWAARTRTINAYGPTETAVCATWFECGHERSDAPPIGRALRNVSVYVLDEMDRTSPPGEVGQICIGGLGVARGYLNRAVETAEQFAPDPFSREPGARMFRTGDLGRVDCDGNLKFVGRNDGQLKVRGIRIEAGDIETQMLQHEAVRLARVVVRKDGSGRAQLLAYYATHDPLVLEPEALRMFLKQQLPETLLPDECVRLTDLPLTANGKLDVRALPAPRAHATSAPYTAPASELEAKVALIWSEVLKVERVGRDDHFFRLGGQSLLGAMVVARIRQGLGIDVRIQGLFDRPVLADFVAHLTQKMAVGASAVLAPRSERSLSFAQRRLWFVSQMEGGSRAYHISVSPTSWMRPSGLRLRGPLDHAALRRALDLLVERHESLRTTFVTGKAEPALRITPAAAGFALQEHDLRGRASAAEELERIEQQEVTSAFDLEQGPLIRGRLVRLHDDEHVLLISMHHLVSDGVSTELLLRELALAYSAFRDGAPPTLPALALQYTDYAAWQKRHLQGPLLQEQSDYWRDTLTGAPQSLALPTDRPRPAHQDFSGAFVDVQLDEELTHQLHELSLRRGVTLYMTLLAGWALVMGRLAQQDDLVIGTPFAGRPRSELESIVGFFVNTLALRIDLSANPTVASLLDRVKERVLGAHQHQDLPFERVVELVNPVRDRSRSPLFQVMFALQNHVGGNAEFKGLAISTEPLPYDTAKFDLLLNLGVADGKIVGGVEFATACFDRQTVERYVRYFRAALQAMAADETRSIGTLPLWSGAEQRQLIEQSNGAATERRTIESLQRRFATQVARTPSAIAVVHEDRRLTYTELDRRAERIAARLRRLGVSPDACVAICVERSLEMIVGVMGILKAGGASVPLDPSYPAERLSYMLASSRAQILLVHKHTPASLLERLRAALPEAATVLDLDQELASDEDSSGVPRAVEVLPQHLAYVLYTSGSTGKPKGVAMTQGALANLIDWQTSSSEPRTTLQFAPLSFDVSFQEIFSALCSGSRLVLIDSRSRQDPARLFEVIRKHEVGRLFLPYVALSMLADWAEAATTSDCALREVIVAGEQLRMTPSIARFFTRLPSCQLHNHYGPTEAHVVTAFSAPQPAQWPELPPIGRPIQGARIYILDRYGAPVPPEVVGELYIGGEVLARGYLHQPGLTAERFLPDPFGEAGARMYRTGDLARYRAGQIEFVERNDTQVKIRGFRIELREVEARLEDHAAVGRVVVIARDDAARRRHLVAYYTAKQETGSDELRRHLAAQLPEYMIPSVFVRLDALPLTPSGKIDRGALPEAPTTTAAASSSADEAPRSETETRLAELWVDILGVERVGRQDHFFDLGGHSLLATMMLLRIRSEFQVELALEDLFNAPVFADFARAIVVKQLASYSRK